MAGRNGYFPAIIAYADLRVGFIGGVRTILSPCILPVLPFVFARHLVLGPTKDGKPVRSWSRWTERHPAKITEATPMRMVLAQLRGPPVQHIREKGCSRGQTSRLNSSIRVQAFCVHFGLAVEMEGHPCLNFAESFSPTPCDNCLCETWLSCVRKPAQLSQRPVIRKDKDTVTVIQFSDSPAKDRPARVKKVTR